MKWRDQGKIGNLYVGNHPEILDTPSECQNMGRIYSLYGHILYQADPIKRTDLFISLIFPIPCRTKSVQIREWGKWQNATYACYWACAVWISLFNHIWPKEGRCTKILCWLSKQNAVTVRQAQQIPSYERVFRFIIRRTYSIHVRR